MKSPLRKRLPRELKSEIGKYLVVFILMVATIGFVSGFLVADGSMITAYNEGFEKYNIEDGNFRTAEQIYKTQREEIEELGVKLYDNFYLEEPLDNGSTMRIFKNREEINKICLMDGELPARTGEMAIDRMYADNNGLSVGDTLQSGKKTWKITGLVALSDYSCLFQNNNDSMFDSVKFGVSVVTEEEFDSLNQDKLQYNYSWIYDQKPETEKEEKEVSEDLMEDIGEIVTLESFVPQYLNQAITFTGDDMGGDKAMVIMLLYIVMVIMAFVFGITISNTIRKEAGVIGTLRASGYTRQELILHYMTLPVLVTLVGALIGNVLGYTVFKDVCAGMYYGSYSLPTYVTRWNAEAFLLTTVVPVIIMLVVNYGVLRHKLKLSPLKFLRRDLSSGRRQKRAIRLSPRIKIFSRFRLRVIFQNMSNYIVLFIGIIFANLLLMFGLLLPSALSHYQGEIQGNMLAKYQYMLQVPVSAVSGNKFESLISLLEFYMDSETDNEDAEEFSAYSLNTLPGKYKMINGFAIMIYMVLIYLLSKIIIEKNAQSISMVKILGYTNGEISRLYIMSTSIVVVICLLLSLPIETAVMNVLFREMMLASISGWITLWIDPMIYVQMFVAGVITYAIVALLEFRKIKKVPMDEALKNVE